MIDLLEQAIAKIRALPAADQDEAAAMLLSVASRNEATVELDDATRAAVREGMALTVPVLEVTCSSDIF